MTNNSFEGFLPPVENWSKLPHQLIEALPLVETIGEMKIILYVLRHTWGYHENEKRITLDEFENGRKRRNGTRIDAGTGLAHNTVKDGIARAQEHGFLVVTEDNSDKGRVKRWYSLAEPGVNNQPPGDQKLIPCRSKVDPRSGKDTLERNSEKDCAAAPLSQERQEQEPKQELPLHWKHVMIDDADFMHTCERCGEDFDVRQCKKSGARCPHCGYEGQVLDGLGSVSHRLPQGVRRKKEAVNPPLDGFGGKPVNALCALFNIAAGDLPPKHRAQWGRRLQDIASATNRDMEELIAALEAMREQFGWKDYGANPYRRDFEDNLLSILLHSDESDIASDLETVPLEELRARLAGGELRMDDLGAGEQAVVLARLGALP